VYLDCYHNLIENELRETMAHNQAWNIFNKSIWASINNNLSFTYETNFNDTPLYWPKIFKENKYYLKLVFFCLCSIEEAKRRVQIRVDNGGHFVTDSEIERRYYEGFNNFEKHWNFFDEIMLFDTSSYKKEPNLFLFLKGRIVIKKGFIPEYLEEYIPNFLNSVSE
jgi:predicted ABC-type ATPase